MSNTLSNRMKAAGLVGMGAIAGVLLSLNFSAVAERQSTTLNLPIEEVRMLSEVFGRIKSDYVEVVDDKRLIKEAINGMLTGLDPHSAFLDADAYKEMQTTTTGKFGGLGIEVGVEDGFVKVISPIDDTPAYRAGIQNSRSVRSVKEQSRKAEREIIPDTGLIDRELFSPLLDINLGAHHLRDQGGTVVKNGTPEGGHAGVQVVDDDPVHVFRVQQQHGCACPACIGFDVDPRTRTLGLDDAGEVTGQSTFSTRVPERTQVPHGCDVFSKSSLRAWSR